MKISWLSIKDFRGFQDCEITLSQDSNIVVFIGVNGAGKSAILDAISILLNVLVCQIDTPKNSSQNLIQDDINLNAEKYILQAQFTGNIHKKGLSESKYSIDSYEISLTYFFADVATIAISGDFIKSIQSSILENELFNLPIFICYQVDGNIIGNRKKEDLTYPSKYKHSQFFAYENAFSNKMNSFSDFSKWFREEDLENQEQIRLKDFNYRNKRLEVIRSAINSFLNKFEFARFSDLLVERSRSTSKRNNPNEESIISYLIIDKDGQKFKFSQLSSGEKMMLSLVVDIARRLVIANPSLENKLEGEGIVLIDEIDLHLHPQWQRKLLPALTHTFPNIQFIVTTHSPQVLSHLPRESVFLLEDNKISDREIYTEGRDSNSILQDAFHVPKYEKEYEKELNDIYHLIDKYDGKNAQELLEKLKEKRGENDLEIMRMQSYIDLL